MGEKRRYLLVAIMAAFCTVTIVRAQDCDSLKLCFGKATQDTIRLRLLVELSNACSDEEVMGYAEPAVALADKLLAGPDQNRSILLKYKAYALNNIGYAHQGHGDFSKALVFYEQSRKMQESIENKHGIASALNQIATVYYYQGDIYKGLEYYKQSLKFLEESGDLKNASTTMNNIGVIYKDLGDILTALEFYHKSMDIRVKLNFKSGISESLNNIGVIYQNQGDHKKSVEHFKNSLKISTEIGDKPGISAALNNLGNYYRTFKDYENALKCYQDCYNVNKEIGDKHGMIYVLNNMGVLYKSLADQQMKNDISAAKENFAKALDLYNQSLSMSEEINDVRGTSNLLNSIGSVFYRQEKFRDAEKYCLRSLSLAKQLGFPEEICNASGMLKAIFRKQNKFRLAYEMARLNVKMNDSISSAETIRSTTQKRMQYEFEKKSSVAKIEFEKQQAVSSARLQKQRLATYIASGVGALILLFLILAIRAYRNKQKANTIISAQKTEVEKQKLIAEEKRTEAELRKLEVQAKQKEILDSIYYARRIQNALITNEKYLEKNLKGLKNS